MDRVLVLSATNCRPEGAGDLSGCDEQGGPEEATPHRVTRRLRVLLTEDNPLCQLEIQLMLEELDVHVELASNGSEAVSKFQNAPFDLVLMDIDMPVMDGLSAIHAVRALERYRGLRPTRIATITGRPAVEYHRAASAAGVCAFLDKPIDPDEIAALVERLAAEKT
jgi:two-component system, sensor histidine kinase